MTNHLDLYRQILQAANKVKDKKLACLVQKRLHPHIDNNWRNCDKIIPFPAAPAGERYIYPEDI